MNENLIKTLWQRVSDTLRSPHMKAQIPADKVIVRSLITASDVEAHPELKGVIALRVFKDGDSYFEYKDPEELPPVPVATLCCCERCQGIRNS